MYGGKFGFQNWLGYLIVGLKFTVFALFYSVFEDYFQVQPPVRLYSEGRLNGGIFALWVEGGGGLIFGGAYTWRAYFRNSTVVSILLLFKVNKKVKNDI